MEVLLPILIVAVLLFGFGVLLVSRIRIRRQGVDLEPPAGAGGVLVEELPPAV